MVLTLAALLLPAVAADAQSAGQAPAAGAAPATPAPAAAPAAKPAAGAASDAPLWVKTCRVDPNTKAQICNTAQEVLLNQDGSLRVSLSIQPIGDKKYGIGGFVPLGFIIPAGVGLAIDGDKKSTAQFMQCNPPLQDLPPGCFISAQVDDAFIAALRKGNELALVLTNGQNQQLPIKMSLAGFAKSYDGEGIDPVAARAQEVEKSKAFQEQAKAAAQRMIDKQRQEAGANGGQ
jgi:invasion protein IalB